MKAEDISQLLPAVIRRGATPDAPLMGLLLAMEAMHDPVETSWLGVDGFFDPWRCPVRYLPILAQWVDVVLPPGVHTGRWRALIAGAAELHQWRGTRRGLVRYLELATGLEGFQVDDSPSSPVPGADKGAGTASPGYKSTDDESFDDQAPDEAFDEAFDEASVGNEAFGDAFSVRLTAPPAASKHIPTIRRILDTQTPAHVRCALELSGPGPDLSTDPKP